MNRPNPRSDESAALAAAAAAWLARRDRGLSAAEQDQFLQWMSEDPRHRAALAREEQTWTVLNALATWQPAHSARPNPDLLAPARRDWRRTWRAGLAVGLAAAAAVAVMILREPPNRTESSPVAHGFRVIPRPERLELSDGSVAELNHGGKFEVAFSPAERRVRLVAGELHVTVAPNPDRPFIVEVDRVAVRAVGTVFNVRRGPDEVEVLVTEGRVEIEAPTAGSNRAGPIPVGSGERARIEIDSPAARPAVSPVTAAEIGRALAWQGVRLEFDAVPLSAVVSEFNLRNVQQLTLGDATVGQIRVAGTFRADQVEAFVGVLEAGFGIVVERVTDGPWLLRRSP